jgi:hypothetical protein
MSSWGNYDASSNAPYWAAASVHKAPTSAEAALLYGNTTNSAYFAGEVDGLFAVDSNEAIVNNNHPGTGWVLRKTGTGSVTTLTANTGAYGANGYITFVGGTGTDANAYMYVKTSGEVKNVVVTSAGSYTVLPTSATPPSGNASLTLTTAGRVGRVHEELLAVVATFKSDNNDDDTIYPDASISIVTQPSSTSIYSSSANSNSATFTVATLAKPTSATTTYVWQYNNASGSIGWTNILNGTTSVGNTTFAGNTSATLTVTPKFTNANTYVFRVTATSTPPAGITNATAASVTSANASITIFAGA